LFTVPGEQKKAGSSEQIVHESKGEVAKVSVKLDGILFNFELPYEGQSILDAALQQGADLPYACKGGVCTTCKAKLAEGKVEMSVNWGLEDEEVQKGYILTCQSHPVTERVVVDFDDR
jgi:ring-1,2-phenylacetyl-CoA epoxidase subunit PaaE